MKVYRGWLHRSNNWSDAPQDDEGGRPDDLEALYLLETPGVWNYEGTFAEVLKDDIGNRKVSVRYWITNVECAPRAAKEAFINSLYGMMDVKYEARYGDITGFLGADEHLMVGGHNLLRELETYAGKWLILEIDIH